jgi:hypothetical protein
MSLAEAAQVSSEPLPFLRPTPDSDVDVIRLREYPAVPTGDRSKLDQDRILETDRAGGASREIALQGEAHRTITAQAQHLRGDAVGTVSTDDERRRDPISTDRHHDSLIVDVDASDTTTVTEIDARRSRLDNQMVIEPSALSHVGDRLAAAAMDGPSSELVEHSVRHHAFDDRLNRTRSEPFGSAGHGAATRFVARERRLIEE